jgi:hypothetical protein
VIALTYGADAEWVRNVLASGGCVLETRGRSVQLTRPRIFHDPHRHLVPAPVRVPLRLLDVADFLELWPGYSEASEVPAHQPLCDTSAANVRERHAATK